jgi:predicted ester cyclase
MSKKLSTISYRWFAEVWNQGLETSIDELLDSTAVIHGIHGINQPGPGGFKVFYHTFRQAFTNIHVEVEDVISQDGYESARCQVTATRKPTGQIVHFSGQTTIRIGNGKIVEGWNNFDFLLMNQQLGYELTIATANASSL